MQECPSAPEEPLAALLATHPHPLLPPAATTPTSDGCASAENSVRSAPIFAATVPGTSPSRSVSSFVSAEIPMPAEIPLDPPAPAPSSAASSTSAQAVPSGYGRIRFERLALDLAAHVVSFFHDDHAPAIPSSCDAPSPPVKTAIAPLRFCTIRPPAGQPKVFQ